MKLSPSQSVLLLIDTQESLVGVVHESAAMVCRAKFLLKIANLLEVPILATEQNPSRMGDTEPELRAEIQGPVSKMTFSAWGAEAFRERLVALNRQQVVIIGLETHICVALTASDLLANGYEVFVCPDAVSARTIERHKLGMEMIRDSGVMPCHTEAAAYQWLATADHPRFREALRIVKAAM